MVLGEIVIRGGEFRSMNDAERVLCAELAEQNSCDDIAFGIYLKFL